MERSHAGGDLCAEDCLAGLTTAGGDQDDTVGATGTEDRCRSGILEDGYRRYLVHVEHTQLVGLTVARHTVDEQQRGVVRRGALATEVHGDVVTTGLTAVLDGSQTCDAAREGVGEVGDLGFDELLVADLLDGTGHGDSLLVTVSHDHGLFKFLLVLFQIDSEFGLVADGNFLGDVTDERDLKGCVCRHLGQGDLAVSVGRTANRVTDYDDIGPRNGALTVGDGNSDCATLQIVVGPGEVNAAKCQQ